MPTSPRRSLPFRFADRNFVFSSDASHDSYIPRPSHTPRNEDPNYTW